MLFTFCLKLAEGVGPLPPPPLILEMSPKKWSFILRPLYALGAEIKGTKNKILPATLEFFLEGDQGVNHLELGLLKTHIFL